MPSRPDYVFLGMKLSLETGQTLHLAPGQKLQVEYKLNPFTFRAIESPRAYSFSLPASPENQSALELAHLPVVSTATGFFGVPGRLTLLGTELRGKLTINTADRRNYEAQFSAILPELGAFADRKLADLLREAEYTFTSTAWEHLNTFATAPDEPIRFPEMKIANRIHNRYDAGAYFRPIVEGDARPVPTFSLLYIFQKCLDEIGWRVRDPDWHTAYPDIAKIHFFNRRPLPVSYTVAVGTPSADFVNGQIVVGSNWQIAALENLALPATLRLAEFVPDMTFGQLLNTMRSLFGLVIVPDSRVRSLSITFALHVLDNEVNDFTAFAEDAQEVELYPDKGLKFKWKKDGADPALKNLPETTPVPLAEMQAFGELSPALPGSFSLLRDYNRYYVQARNTSGFLEWQASNYALSNYELDPDGSDIAAEAMPQQTTNLLRFEGKDGDIGPSPTGKVRLLHVNTVQLRPATIEFKNAKAHVNDVKSIVTADSDALADLELPFVEADPGVEWVRQVIYPRSIPEHGGGLIVPENGNVPTQHPRLLFWHGLQPGQDGAGYPYASFTNYTLAGQKLADFSLRWEGKEGLVDTFYAEVVAALDQARQVTQNFRLPAEAIAKLQPGLRIRVRETVYVALSATVDFGPGDSHPLAKMKLLRLNAAAQAGGICQNTFTVEEYLNCEPAEVPEDPSGPSDVDNPQKRPVAVEFYADCWPQVPVAVEFYVDCLPIYTISIIEAC